MTEQRIFPFFVNGVFWKNMAVDEEIIKRGRIDYSVIPKEFNKCPLTKIKQIFFQLAECAQQKNGMVANWISGFWLCDEELYIEDKHLYLKP